MGRMEDIAARSAQSPSEYVENKAINDALAAVWGKTKKKEVEKQARRVSVAYGPTGEGRSPASIVELTQRGRPSGETVVLVPTVLPPVVSEPPVDMVDYSISPIALDIPWEQSPVTIVAVPAVIGTMMVMLGKRMLVSMAIAGLQYAQEMMPVLQQYGKGLPRAQVLWHTGRSGGKQRASVSSAVFPEMEGAPRRTGASATAQPTPTKRREVGARGPSDAAVTATPHISFSDAMQAGADASEWLSEQIRTFYGFPGWLD